MATEAQYRKRVVYSADLAGLDDYYEAVNASRYRDSGRRIPRGDWQPRDRRGRFVKMRLSEE